MVSRQLSDLRAVCRGVEILARSLTGIKRGQWCGQCRRAPSRPSGDGATVVSSATADIGQSVSEVAARANMVAVGVRQWASLSSRGVFPGADTTITRTPVEPDVDTTVNDSEIEVARRAPEVVDAPSRCSEADSLVAASPHELSEWSRERRVPTSRLGRVASFGRLAVGLGVGTAAEVARRGLGLAQANAQSADSLVGASAVFSVANMERIVDTLCRVRGAALKLGQMLSIQDASLINPALQEVLTRVRHSADFMPVRQVTRVLEQELGAGWRDHFAVFDERPFAAASIGQVHRAVLPDGRELALKIQYPGVANSIKSDIDNLVSVLSVGGLFPKGMYLDSFVKVAQEELSLECDYVREAESSRKFKALIADDADLFVPEVLDELSTRRVLTTELVSGVPLDRCVELAQTTRDWVGEKMLRLCLREMFEFRFMQTDPNWSNFFFAAEPHRRLVLLDFGASRPYERAFIDAYLRLIKAAAEQDRAAVLAHSRRVGFLTGHETRVMERAHCDAVLILGEAFASDAPFDFGRQDAVRRIQRLIPTMIEHRLTPPPEEIYSLHRKLSGIFLLCSKLGSRVVCAPLFHKVFDDYAFSTPDDVNAQLQRT